MSQLVTTAGKHNISKKEWDYCFNLSFVEVLDFVKYVWNFEILNLTPKTINCFYCKCFFDVTFKLETVSTNMTFTTHSIWLFKWKRHLRQCNVKSVKHTLRRNNNKKCTCKKSTWFLLFLVGNLNILNIFFKIQNLNKRKLKLVVPIVPWNIKLHNHCLISMSEYL